MTKPVSLETVISLFSIVNGEVKILLVKKASDPYKGYWMLSIEEVKENEEAAESVDRVVDKLGFRNAYLEQYYTFTKIDKSLTTRPVTIGYIGLIDTVSAMVLNDEEMEAEFEWFNINRIPKLAYNHDEIVIRSIEVLKNKIVSTNVIKNLFPSDFTLPELQRTYESILNIKLDRRNFRKKFINLDLIEDTGDKNVGFGGRPAKLYRFKDELKNKNLF